MFSHQNLSALSNHGLTRIRVCWKWVTKQTIAFVIRQRKSAVQWTRSEHFQRLQCLPWGDVNCKVWLLSLTISVTIRTKYFKLWCYNFLNQGLNVNTTSWNNAATSCQFNRTWPTLWVHNRGSFSAVISRRLWWELIFVTQLMWIIICASDGWFHFLSDDLRATRSDSKLYKQKRFLLRSSSFVRKFHFSILRGEVFITWLHNPHSCIL